MAWNYRRRIKIIPGVHLNFSKSGITTSIGVKGASLTFGKKGTYLNSSIPGLGIYKREKLSSQQPSSSPQNSDFQPVPSAFSEDLHVVTSQNMQGIKEAIIASYQQRKELHHDLSKIKSTLFFTKFKLFISYLLLYGLIIKSVVAQSDERSLVISEIPLK